MDEHVAPLGRLPRQLSRGLVFAVVMWVFITARCAHVRPLSDLPSPSPTLPLPLPLALALALALALSDQLPSKDERSPNPNHNPNPRNRLVQPCQADLRGRRRVVRARSSARQRARRAPRLVARRRHTWRRRH